MDPHSFGSGLRASQVRSVLVAILPLATGRCEMNRFRTRICVLIHDILHVVAYRTDVRLVSALDGQCRMRQRQSLELSGSRCGASSATSCAALG